MSAALITASLLSAGGLVWTFALGYATGTSSEVLRHTTLAIFFTLITLLVHSMTIFYLIGKVRAIRDAVIEGELVTDALSRVSALRGRVFKSATVAMGLTMVTAILGGGVDTGAIPAGVHATLAVLAVVSNFVVLRAVIEVLQPQQRVVLGLA